MVGLGTLKLLLRGRDWDTLLGLYNPILLVSISEIGLYVGLV